MVERLAAAPPKEQELPEHTLRPEISAENIQKMEDSLQQDGVEARATARREALSASREKPKTGSGDRRSHNGHIGRDDREQSYKQTMRSVQKQLSPASRSFSKVIHQPAVEKASDVVGATIARPTSLLVGSLFAFVTVLGLYVFAWQYGFSLSGFEMAGAFAVGWAVGLGVDGWRGLRRRA